jgi:glycosyltransferase involved in cell wall biosynthesis
MESMSVPNGFNDTLLATLPEADGPLVSVIMPTYDDAKYIQRALRSLSEQTYTNLEAIIVDSSKVSWLSDLIGELDWAEYIYEPPNGVAAARNRGIDVANGDIVMFLDADDFYAPEKLERQVATLEGEADIVYSNVTIINESGDRTELFALPVKDPIMHHIDFFQTGHGVPTVTVAACSSCFEMHRFDERLTAREDPHLWTRIFKDYRPAKIPAPLAYKRRRSNSLTSDPDMMYENEMAAITDLTNQYAELDAHRDEREQMAKYRYAKQLFHASRTSETRRLLIELMRTGLINHQTVSLFALSLLPVGNKRAYKILERIQESAKRRLGSERP